MQSFPNSDVILNWVRDIDHFAANDTLPLNVTVVDTADIVSTLRVRPVFPSAGVCSTYSSTAQRTEMQEALLRSVRCSEFSCV